MVFDGPEDYHHRIDDPTIALDSGCCDARAGPIGYPGAAEVVNMRPPAALILDGVHALPCIGDGRQSGTSGSPSILNASPEAAAGGGLALLRTGDRVRIDLGGRSTCCSRRPSWAAPRRPRQPAATPIRPRRLRGRRSSARWSAECAEGMLLKPAHGYQRLAQTAGLPRDNH